MDAKPISDVSFEIIDAMGPLVGFEFGYYRILTQSSAIKYLAYIKFDISLPDIRGERLAFNTVPEGDWNIGQLVLKSGTDQLILDTVEKKLLSGISSTWCPNLIDYSTLKEVSSSQTELQGQNQMHSFICRDWFGIASVIVNFEWNPDNIYGLARETDIYALIQKHHIGPRFLAHVTENSDRVIGYMAEHIEARKGTSNDIEACRNALSKLHGLGIALGCLSPASFLIQQNGHALLNGFASAYQTKESPVFEAEMESVEHVLQPDWKPFKRLSQELVMNSLLLQAFQEGKLNMSEDLLRDVQASLSTG